MSRARAERETAELFRGYAREARAAADAPVLIAIDYEIGGVHRLHDLGPQLSDPSAALAMSDDQLEEFGRAAGSAAKSLGINFFLAPVLDILGGPNPWLANRCLAADPPAVGRITAAFVRGVQREGVAATAKHFPGHHRVKTDPFDDPSARVPGSRADLEPGLTPYRAVIAEGVKAVMTGPVPTDGMDPNQPSSASPIVVRALREEFGFRELIVSDDIDLPGTMRGRTLAEVAVAALSAGVELLLLAAPQADAIAMSIAEAVRSGQLSRSKLARAADAVRRLARDVN